ncbi:hypothetical protein EII31_04770 [Leucobacter sp. OH2974_COT-288]|nr:hypothetical protein EII31_04770 [Leucobacter sp. OH2974_COT-288]
MASKQHSDKLKKDFEKPSEGKGKQATYRSTAAISNNLQRLRSIVESANLNFLVGAGTSNGFFPMLGNIEESLTELADEEISENAKALVRASIQAYFFNEVISPNLKILKGDLSGLNQAETEALQSYKNFVRTLNRILLLRRNSILSKQVNIFTTNIDMLFEVAMEETGVEYSDGFNGKIKPKFDLGDFGTLRFRTSARYDNRFEVPVFNLVKIHGSAAWYQCEGENVTEIYFDHGLTLVSKIEEQLEAAQGYLLNVLESSQNIENFPVIKSVGTLVSEAEQKIANNKMPNEVEEFAETYNKLGIINPDKRKFATTVLNETYYELIRRFANELEKENSVLFVHGFSFRDEHIRDIVLRAARTNPTLQVIVFCYNVKAREDYEKILLETQIKNGNIDFVVPPESCTDEAEPNISLAVLEHDYFTPIIADKLA